MDHDLLTAPLLSWRDAQGRRGKTTLPGLLERLGSGELADFPRVRTHQMHPWSMFLTQLAAIALRRAGGTNPTLPEAQWRRLLVALTSGAREPWCVVVGDLARPAFMQPPVPEGSVEDWRVSQCPDDIDVLMTAKGHDVKTGLIESSDVEEWVYALVTLQTTQGYPGRGYNRISRMNGGYGTRVRVGLAPDQSLGTRFARDAQVLLSSWEPLLERGYDDEGLALVWTEPWDGARSLPVAALAPHFIEICWRLRLESAGDGLRCAYTTTQARRCLPEIDNGDVGDPWIPIERTSGNALTVGRRGFHYELLVKLLFDSEYAPAAAQSLRQSDAESMLLLAAGMARGQGKTEGLHERELAISGRARVLLGDPGRRTKAAARAEQRVASASKMHSKVLYPALKRLARGGDAMPDAFDARVDDIFFDHFFSTLDAGDDEAQLAWENELRTIAGSELERSIERCCLPDAARLRAIADAESMFSGCLRKAFPDLVAGGAGTEGATT